MVGGVCAGVADCFGIDVTLVRIAAVVFALAGGLAVPIYLALWLLVPEEGTEHTVLSNVMRGPAGPRPVTTPAVDAQGGAMAPCSPHSPRSDEHDWSHAGAYRSWPGQWWRGGWPGSTGDQGMRIGDAERSQVSETLSRHYAAGRLDDEEFNQRMSQAMGAKTRADLSGLLVDLPLAEPDNVPAHRHRFGFGRFVLVCIAVLIAASIASSLFWVPHFTGAWIVIAVLAFFVLRWERHRHWHRVHGG
jgi:phage shock protein PspC (stress-responsive transcriptional regulator)